MMNCIPLGYSVFSLNFLKFRNYTKVYFHLNLTNSQAFSVEMSQFTYNWVSSNTEILAEPCTE